MTEETTKRMLWEDVPRTPAPEGRVNLSWSDLLDLLKRYDPALVVDLRRVVAEEAEEIAEAVVTIPPEGFKSSKVVALENINGYLGGTKSFNPIEAMRSLPLRQFDYWVFAEICYRVLDGAGVTRELRAATFSGDERRAIVEAVGQHADSVYEGVGGSDLTYQQVKDLAIRLEGAI